MLLNLLNFVQNDSQGNEWKLNNFSFGKINLLVGKNAAGKSRTLNVLANLASLIAGEAQFVNNSRFYADFEQEGKNIKYSLLLDQLKIAEERLVIDDDVLLQRGNGGEGAIYAAELDRNMKFQVPNTVLACVARRGSIQHPYFDFLYNWGKSTRHYYFGTHLGKDHLVSFADDSRADKLNAKDSNQVAAFFKRGAKETGDEFSNKIIEYINAIGYEISAIGIAPIENVETKDMVIKTQEGLYIKEKDHAHTVNQMEMSQGLFRALSLFIQLRYSEQFSVPGLILVDDIGEGLDYERSTSLIKSLIRIAENTGIQLVMTTNDRFVMNNVPLEYWCVLHREGGNCTVLNYRNSKKLFDEFELTGLSNFDFFSSKYCRKK